MADLSTTPPLTRESVIAARELIKEHLHLTPVLTSETLSRIASTPRDASELEGTRWAGRTPAKPVVRLYFKCENMQKIGAFKARGAFHAVKRLMQEPGWLENGGKEKGVIAHSSGNHAQALSLAAREHGIKARIVMPEISMPSKIAATKGYGAEIIYSGSTSTEREAVTNKVIAETGARLVHPYDHPDILLGQGTMGLELQEQAQEIIAAKGHKKQGSRQPGLDAIVTPLGGGGMVSGTSLSCDGTGVKVFGCEPSFSGADDAKRGVEAGARVEKVSSLTIADGLRTPLGELAWDVITRRKLVSGLYSVTEDEIRETMRLVLERLKVVVEPSGVVGLAAVLFDEDFRALIEREAGPEGWDLGVVFSGGNLAVERIVELFGPEKA